MLSVQACSGRKQALGARNLIAESACVFTQSAAASAHKTGVCQQLDAWHTTDLLAWSYPSRPGERPHPRRRS
jgi:hypothetical protein